jgi:hypothetical protein
LGVGKKLWFVAEQRISTLLFLASAVDFTTLEKCCGPCYLVGCCSSVLLPRPWDRISLEGVSSNMLNTPHALWTGTQLIIALLMAMLRCFLPPQKISPSMNPAHLTPLPQNGFAAFLLSPFPVTGSRNSFQLTGYISLPSSLLAIMTPNSFRSVAT